MAKKSATVALGALEIEVPQFTLGQLEKIAEWLIDSQQLDLTRLVDIVRSYRSLLTIGLEKSSPAFTQEQIDDLKMDVNELREAGAAFLRLAGLQPGDGPIDPEAPAPDGASPTTLILSTESLPPDAATRPN